MICLDRNFVGSDVSNREIETDSVTHWAILSVRIKSSN